MKPPRLDKRLTAAAGFVRENASVADIGTDHAHLPVYLAMIGRIKFAVASDINLGPLTRAERNIKKYHVENKVVIRLSDGLSNLRRFDLNDIVICGMGGETIIRILSDASWLNDEGYRLILQPMTRPEKVREYLLTNGFNIVDEALTHDTKVYHTICADFDRTVRTYSPAELLLGRHNIQKGGESFDLLLKQQLAEYETRVNGKMQSSMISGGAEEDIELTRDKAVLTELQKIYRKRQYM